MGLFMVFNTTAASIIDHSLEIDVNSAFYKQLAYSFFGFFVGWISYRLGHEWFISRSPYILGVITLLLLLLFVPGVASSVKGAKRWLNIYGFYFQPSEFAKIFIPGAFIQIYLKRQNWTFVEFFKLMSVFTVPIALILLEPDNGTTAIICVLLTALFVLAKVKWVFWFLPLLVIVTAAGFAATKMPHVHRRIEIYLHPELDLKGKGHQPHQSKIAAGSGGLFGRGLGESIQKLNYLPEARTDYIAAIYAEETGFIGMIFLIGLYCSLGIAGIWISLRAPNLESFLFGSVLTLLIMIQSFVNLGVVSGLLPSKGMTLPFFSRGGTSLLVNWVCIFFLLDIDRKRREFYPWKGKKKALREKS
jgi:cell division protein FtsW